MFKTSAGNTKETDLRMRVGACCIIESFAVSSVCTVSNPDEAVELRLLVCQHCRMLLAELEATVLQRVSSGRSDLVLSVSCHTIHPPLL